jgi:single-strand DNA-binding protein
VSRSYKSKNGDSKEETEWFNIVAWNKLAETCERYLHKGSKVYIEGRLTQRKYTDKNGNERTAVDVIASGMEMLTPKSASGGEGYSAGGVDDNDPFLPDYPDDIS